MSARLRPSQVLDEHVKLTEALRHPPDRVARYYDNFVQSVLEDAERTGGQSRREAAQVYLFHPAKTGRDFATVLARQLAFARTYQISPGMVDAVTATYLKSVTHVGHMEEQEVPAESGFAWFDAPLVFTDVNGLRVLHRALSWSPSSVRFSDGDAWQGVRITAWCHTDDDDDFWDSDTMAWLKQIGLDGLTLSHSVIVPFGQRFLRRQDMDVSHSVTAPLMDQLTMLGPPEGRVRGGSMPVGDDLARWTHTLFMFLDMELVTTSTRELAERHARKRGLRSLNHGDVNVITLRRTAHAKEGEPGHRNVDWSCRWPVQGFWRHIEQYAESHHHAVPDETRAHCASCGARLSWVRPHLRGPADRPLKQARQLYRLTR